MSYSWTITNRRHIQSKFDSLMPRIARSDPEAIIFAVWSCDGGAVLGSLIPNIRWSPEQEAGLAQNLLAQVSVLTVRTAMGDTAALKALSLAQDSRLLAPWHDQIRSGLAEVVMAGEQSIVQVIRSLLIQAMSGDLAALKAAADVCVAEEYSRRDGSLAEVLPRNINSNNLDAMVRQYFVDGDAFGLPPFTYEPF